MPDKRYTKVEEEIIQILDRMDDGKLERPHPHLRLVKAPKPRRRLSLGKLARGMPLAFIVGSFVFALLAIYVRDSSSSLATLFAIVAAATFLAPIVIGRGASTSGGPSSIEGKMWRGRDITFSSSSSESPIDRARRWMETRRRR